MILVSMNLGGSHLAYMQMLRSTMRSRSSEKASTLRTCSQPSLRSTHACSYRKYLQYLRGLMMLDVVAFNRFSVMLSGLPRPCNSSNLRASAVSKPSCRAVPPFPIFAISYLKKRSMIDFHILQEMGWCIHFPGQCSGPMFGAPPLHVTPPGPDDNCAVFSF